MTALDTAMEFVWDNRALILIVALVVAILIFRYFKKKKLNKSKPFLASAEPSYVSVQIPEFDDMFEDINTKDVLTNMREQKVTAERHLKKIKEEGKILAGERNNLIYDYKQNMAGLESRRRQLGMQFTSWTNQLKALEDMIQSQQDMINGQIEMEREFGRMKKK